MIAAMTKKWTALFLLIGLSTMLACTIPLFTPTPTPTPTVTPTPTQPPTPTPLPEDTGWQNVQPGIEARSLNVDQQSLIPRGICNIIQAPGRRITGGDKGCRCHTVHRQQFIQC